MRLGIDFGTTRTVVAAALEGRYPVALFETAQGFSEFVPGLALRDGARLEVGCRPFHQA
jgi:molecular chaperone DnaK (HSP70)